MTIQAVFLHPAPVDGGWRYRPSAAQMAACERFLRERGIIEGAAEASDDGQALRWRMGPGVEDLGLHWHNGERVELASTEEVQVFVPPGLELACPRCDHPLDPQEWGRGMGQLMESGTEPAVPCGCPEGCLLTAARDPVGYVIARFTIRLERASGPVLHHRFLADLSRVLGLPVGSTSYHL